MRTKRAAFQTLLANALYPFIRSVEKGMSVPGTAMEESVKRTASEPYSSISCRGSMTFPRVLLIFLWLASRTIPLM